MQDTQDRTYHDVAEIKRANAAHGHHFFDADAMRFFGSKIGRKVYGGRYFITSEQREYNTPRRYSIRMALNDGSIESVSAFMRYESRERAEQMIRALLRELKDPSALDVVRETAGAHVGSVNSGTAVAETLARAFCEAHLMAAKALEELARDDTENGSVAARLALSWAIDRKAGELSY